MAGLDIAERRLTQDGRIKLKMGIGGELGHSCVGFADSLRRKSRDAVA